MSHSLHQPIHQGDSPEGCTYSREAQKKLFDALVSSQTLVRAVAKQMRDADVGAPPLKAERQPTQRMAKAPLAIKDRLIVDASGGVSGVRDWIAA
jgi:hypothetical protein